MPPHPPTYDDDLRARNERKKGNGGTGLREGLIGSFITSGGEKRRL